ncbi:hypothetical protein [Streptomyces sp. NPDC057686]|uniref:hypothetical protein n=1 Tax=Streptomyces sp. NPDC057686 TaxID=3346212 RepID=UPI00368F6C43
MSTVIAVRRLAVAFSGLSALLLTSACSPPWSKEEDSIQVEVKGKFGENPKIEIKKGGNPPKTAKVTTVIKGAGRKITRDDYVRIDYSAKSFPDNKVLGSTWQLNGSGKSRRSSQLSGSLNRLGPLPTKVVEALKSGNVGDRIVVNGPPSDLSVAPSPASPSASHHAWVVDIVDAIPVDKKKMATGKRLKTQDGMPQVVDSEKKPPVIKIPDDIEPPTNTRQQLLIQGNGRTVKPGDALILNFAGAMWQKGQTQTFSSWAQGDPVTFQTGTNAGRDWDALLAGKKIGDRVEVVLPVKNSPTNKKAEKSEKAAQVYVIDIIGVI